MKICINSTSYCSGLGQGVGEIIIRYTIQGGIQQSYHENPGVRFSAITRTAYLPNDEGGKQLLKRLKYAFLRGLTFTIGTSLTSGQPNQVTWASIHHKTSTSGGTHGYPDPSYIGNCNEELDNAGVPKANEL